MSLGKEKSYSIRRWASSQAFLDAAVDHVLGKGYEVITLEELWRRRDSLSMERRVVVFTFDDGYRDNATLALPIFSKYRVPWSLFLTTGFPDQTCNYWWGMLERALLDRGKFDLEVSGISRRYITSSIAQKRTAYAQIKKIGRIHSDELVRYLAERYGMDRRALLDEHTLSWTDIRRLASSGLVEIGAHSVTHPDLTRVAIEDVRREMRDCRWRIHEETGVDASHFAYPYGAAGPREYNLARESGYKSGATSVARGLYPSLDEDPYAFPRIGLNGRNETLSQLEAHLSGLTGLLTLRSKHPPCAPP